MNEILSNDLNNEKDLARLRFHKRVKSIRKLVVKPSRPHSKTSYKRERFNWKNDF